MNAPASHLVLTDTLVELGQWLGRGGYSFTTPTPGELWSALRAEGLLDPRAPTPSA